MSKELYRQIREENQLLVNAAAFKARERGRPVALSDSFLSEGRLEADLWQEI